MGDIRIATYNTELSRDGPGLFLRDILKREAPDIEAATRLIAEARADVIVLQGVDYDLGLVALSALRDRIGEAGVVYPHLFAGRPNSGIALKIDIDGDGRRDGARDAQGYGRFAGAGGMAVLSRWPVTLAADHSEFLWRDLTAGLIAPNDAAHRVQRLSSVAHWTLEVTPEDSQPVTLMTFHATPPVFDGPEDRNGRRNHDEAAFWLQLLDGALKIAPPEVRFVLLGVANLDPVDGEGRPEALQALLSHPKLQDPKPASARARLAAQDERGVNSNHRGDPALDTANWRDDPGPGNLRVDYVLPSADWTITGSGVLWGEPIARDGEVQPPMRHGLVWVDLR